MTTVRARAPITAWVLTALTGILVGLAIVESRQTVLLSAGAPVGVADTIGAATPPSAPAEWLVESGEVHESSLTALFEVAPVELPAGPSLLRLTRLTLPPGLGLPFEVAPGPMTLLVESGSLVVRFEGVELVELGLDSVERANTLDAGESQVFANGARYAVRNDGLTPAVVLVVALVRAAAPTPILGPGEPPG